MAPKRRSATARRERLPPYDSALPQNWTVAKLRTELAKRGIHPPHNVRHGSLVQRFNQTIVRDTIHISQDAEGIPNNGRAVVSQSHNPPQNTNGGLLLDIITKLSDTVNALEEKVTKLSDKVDSMASHTSGPEIAPRTGFSPPTATVTEFEGNEIPNYTLDTALRATQTPFPLSAGEPETNWTFPGTSTAAAIVPMSTDMPIRTGPRDSTYVKTAYGYSAESLPFVETISPHLRKNITEGKDINLASLLIPYYTGTATSDHKSEKSDPRLNKPLSLAEFIQAFGIYKNIMCSIYPHRRAELDLYERDIVDMATRYGGRGFYEYHKQFSLRAAAHLRYQNIQVDWSIRNNTLFCNIFANQKPNTCNLCNSTIHPSGFCPMQLHPNQANGIQSVVKNNFIRSATDSYGRPRQFYLGQEICNNYNGNRGCVMPRCNNLHLCVVCKREHSKMVCPMSKSGPKAAPKML